VPTKKPARVSRSSGFASESRAIPKSSSLAVWVAGSYMMLAGLRSRWMIPARWATVSAAPSCSMIVPTKAGASLPDRFTNSASGSPLAHSNAM
jgi:hypothetical protein